ncbi:hypothetical protein LTR74_002301 [Friedmanniomyces endolithicus]|nr:hypothetical protein LTR74_002301 [Friedmanniomyces endolithicus]
MGADECEVGMWRSITGNQLGSSVTDSSATIDHPGNGLLSHQYAQRSLPQLTVIALQTKNSRDSIMNNEDTDIFLQSAIADGVEHAAVRVASGNAATPHQHPNKHAAVQEKSNDIDGLRRWWTAPAGDSPEEHHPTLGVDGVSLSFVGRPLPELWMEGDRLPGKGVADMPSAPGGTPRAGPRDEERE